MATTTKDPKSAAIEVYCNSKAEGKSNDESLKRAKGKAEIGHAILDLNWYADPRNPNVVKPVASLAGATEEIRAQATVALRGGGGWKGDYEGTPLSWGRIAIALGLFTYGDAKSPEGRVRRLFEEGTSRSVVSEGTRIGRGGRWLSNDPTLYPGNHKSIGVEDAKPRSVDRKALAEGADEAKSKVKALATKKATAAKRVRKAAKK